MRAEPFDEFDDRFEDDDTWLDDFDDRDAVFDEAAESNLLDKLDIDFTHLDATRRIDLGPLLDGDSDDDHEDGEIAA